MDTASRCRLITKSCTCDLLGLDLMFAVGRLMHEDCCEQSFRHCAAEEGSPDEVWEAINLLKCARLDHGVRAMEDPACIAFLEETQVPLTVCPRSNNMVRLAVFELTLMPLGL